MSDDNEYSGLYNKLCKVPAEHNACLHYCEHFRDCTEYDGMDFRCAYNKEPSESYELSMGSPCKFGLGFSVTRAEKSFESQFYAINLLEWLSCQ